MLIEPKPKVTGWPCVCGRWHIGYLEEYQQRKCTGKGFKLKTREEVRLMAGIRKQGQKTPSYGTIKAPKLGNTGTKKAPVSKKSK